MTIGRSFAKCSPVLGGAEDRKLEELSFREIVGAIGAEFLVGNPEARVRGVSTDTRQLKPGDLFFALKGEHADGHQYVRAAVEGGAAGVVVSDESVVPSGCGAAVLKAGDPLWALGDLSHYYRGKFDIRVVGVTGSVGKTTTKEMLASILERKWKVLKNAENFNNEIGVPLTLFQLDRSHEVVVIEMAMRGLGEIRRLACIAEPVVGVITNIGLSHVERLGSQGGIADAKAELLGGLPRDGLAVLNAEDGYYLVMRDRFAGRIVSFGSCAGADVIGARIRHSGGGRYRFVIATEGGSVEVELGVLGYHNVYNALAAAAAAYGMGVDLCTIRDGLERCRPATMRTEMVKSKTGYAVLNDAYNASPASMFAALKTLQTLTGYKRKIAVLGDMLELGEYAEKAHRDVGCAVAEHGVHVLVTVGPLAEGIAEGAKEAGFHEDAIQCCKDSLEAAEKLKAQVAGRDAILIKGSRGMKMERIAEVLLGE